MMEVGCLVQLYIYLYWEKLLYDSGKWNIVIDGCYKLVDFLQDEIECIVWKYYVYFVELMK